MADERPIYLYKILSMENWVKSQNSKMISLSEIDSEFIHLSKLNQLKFICKKYWGNVPKYMVLKLETSKLIGNLVFEANEGGKNKYYHLYEGAIPLNAIVEARSISKEDSYF